jgi:dipeptidyl aminopeptidase/acylaminoacyl peptidase
LAGVVAYYGVYDLLPLVSFVDGPYDNPINQLLGKTADLVEACRKASPIHQLTSKAPPFLLIHGLNDSVVPVTQTGAFTAALQNTGVPVQTIYVQGADHLLLGIPGPTAPSLPVIDRNVLSFLRRVLHVD